MINVICHGPACPDGFAAAWVANAALGDKAQYFFMNYGDPMPPLDSDGPLYILDFSFKRDIMMELAEHRQVVCLDHHKTAKADLEGLILPNEGLIVFDMNKCGSMLTWQYFFPNLKVPTLLEHIQDRDLWLWRKSNSREISAAIDLADRTFSAWDGLSNTLDDDDGYNDVVVSGRAVLKYIQQKVAYLAAKSYEVLIDGHCIPCVNSSSWQSELGEKMCELHPEAAFAAVFFIKDGTEQVWSLRSRNGFDVSVVAKGMGGGGHAAAAGFVIKV
jgi:oligoribonuclease NrnB/cAMP/cGMP phosphodiesterase (DHH superfamily)